MVSRGPHPHLSSSRPAQVLACDVLVSQRHCSAAWAPGTPVPGTHDSCCAHVVKRAGVTVLCYTGTSAHRHNGRPACRGGLPPAPVLRTVLSWAHRAVGCYQGLCAGLVSFAVPYWRNGRPACRGSLPRAPVLRTLLSWAHRTVQFYDGVCAGLVSGCCAMQARWWPRTLWRPSTSTCSAHGWTWRWTTPRAARAWSSPRSASQHARKQRPWVSLCSRHARPAGCSRGSADKSPESGARQRLAHLCVPAASPQCIQRMHVGPAATPDGMIHPSESLLGTQTLSCHPTPHLCICL